MSKVRNLPETTTLDDSDLFYTVDASEGPNGGRKITKANLKSSVSLTAAEIKTAYESNADTNAFTDAEKSKLATVNNEYATNVVSGRIVHYQRGQIHYDGDLYVTLPGDILLNANITDAHLYVDIDGLVKQTGSNSEAPPLTFPIAKFTTDANNVVALEDHRVFINRNLDAGDNSDVTSIQAGSSASIGNTGHYADAGHTHSVSTGTPVTIGTANSPGDATSLARSNHVHAHGDQAGGSLHAAATTSVSGFMSSADKAKLDPMVFGFMSYTNSASQSTTQASTGFTPIVINTDTGSFSNSLLTKLSTTQIQVDFTGYLEVSYAVSIQNVSGNDRAVKAAVGVNGTYLSHTSTRTLGKTNTDRYASSGGTFVIPCTSGDLITLGFSNAEAATTDTLTIYANGASLTVKALYKTA